MGTLTSKNRVFVFIFGFTVLSFLVWAASGEFAGKLSWTDVVDRGGIQIMEPVQVDRSKWFIPIRFDISGRRSIANEPRYLDSYATVASVQVQIKDRVCISIVRSNITNLMSRREIYGVYVDEMPHRVLDVFYCDDASDVFLRTLDFREVAYPQIGTREPPPKVEE